MNEEELIQKGFDEDEHVKDLVSGAEYRLSPESWDAINFIFYIEE